MDMTVWLEYFVDGLHSQMKEIHDKGKEIIKNDTALQKMKKAGLNARQEKVIKFIFQNGKVMVNDYQTVASCTRRTAQRDLDDLLDKKIIKAIAKSLTDPTKYFILL